MRTLKETTVETSGGVGIEVGDNHLEEYRNSLDLLADVFCDLPESTPYGGHISDSQNDDDGQINPYHGNENQQSTNVAQDILTNLAAGAMGEYAHTDSIRDVVKDTEMEWSDTSRALLELVHSDHPYLSKSHEFEDREQTPPKSNSCTSIPDAELIHDFFLHTTNMIAYQPIAEVGNQPNPSTVTTLIGSPQLLPKVNLVQNLLDSQRTEIPATSEVVQPNDQTTTSSKIPTQNDDLPPSHCESVAGEQSKEEEDKDPQTHKAEDKLPETNDTSSKFESRNLRVRRGRPRKDANYQVEKSQNVIDVSVHNKQKTTGKGGSEDKSNKSDTVAPSDAQPTDDVRSPDDHRSASLRNMVQSQPLDEWTAACKAVTDKVQEESLLNCAINLMLEVWTDYLTLSFEEVREREIDRARQLDFCDEVIEMLEDNDRYVWQIIEEMEPRNFSLGF